MTWVIVRGCSSKQGLVQRTHEERTEERRAGEESDFAIQHLTKRYDTDCDKRQDTAQNAYQSPYGERVPERVSHCL